MMRKGRRNGREGARVPLARIKALAEQIGRRFRADKVVLFGSYAYGRPTADSDVDLLVIVRTRRDSADVAGDIACALDPEFPIDIVVRTPAEVEWRLAEQECFLTEVLERGRVLYEARRARVG